MKIYALLFVFCLMLAACSGRDSYPAALRQAARCVDTRPDSARMYLEAVRPDSLRGEARAFYGLLRIKTDDKLRVAHTSDSLALSVADYYKGRDPEKFMEASYLLGRVYRDMGKPLEATKAFRQALEADPGSGRHDILGRIYEQLFYVYSYQNAFGEALDFVNLSCQNYQADNDTVGVAYALRNRARLYEKAGRIDSMEASYREAVRMAFSAHDLVAYYSTLKELAAMLVRYGRFDDSERILSRMPEEYKRGDGIVQKTIADIYRHRQQPDSARRYYRQALQARHNRNLNLQEKIYQALADLDSVSDPRSAFRYSRLAVACADSIRSKEHEKSVETYELQQTKIRNQELQLGEARKRAAISLLIAAGCLLLGLLLVARKRVRAYRQKAREEKERSEERRRQLEDIGRRLQQARSDRNAAEQTLQQLQARIDKLQQAIEEKKKIIAENEQQAHKKRDKIAELEMFLQQMKEAGQQTKQTLEQKERELEEYRRMLQSYSGGEPQRLIELYHSNIVRFFSQTRNHKAVTRAHWAELEKAVEQVSPAFGTRLLEKAPGLSRLELQVCYLRKAGVQPKCIASLFSCSSQNVTMMRSRIYGKLTGEKGGAKDFDRFIADF